MVDLMHIFGLIPDAIRLVDENQIFVLRVHHLANVVEVHVLEKNKNLHDVGCMCWASKSSLTSILHVHVLVIITITFLFKSPATTILELLRDLPPVPVVGQPRKRGGTIGSIDFESVETGAETKSAESKGLPEAYPFNNSSVLIDSLTLLKAECRIGVHRWSLYEWLELVTGMGRCSFDSNDSFDGLLTEDGVAET